MGRKYCGKRRNCLLQAIAPFPTVFSKDLCCKYVKPGLIRERKWLTKQQNLDDIYLKYNITCIKRPPKGSNKSGLLQQVVFKCRFYLVDLRWGVASKQWSLTAGGCLIQVVCITGITVLAGNNFRCGKIGGGIIYMITKH